MLKSSQDILGRLASVTEDATPSDDTDDPQTDASYSYDLLGRKRAQLTFAPGDTVPNSVETSYLYDSIGRLDVMTDTDSNGNTLASYDYTVRADGKRTSSTEQTWFDENGDGVQDAGEVKTTTTSWTYDDAGRLADEVIDHWDDAVDQTESFTYDLTGNRAALDRDKGNNGTIDEAITYQYDANDRLLDEVLDSIVDTDDTTTTYAYDQTQQTSKTVTSTTTQLPVSAQQFTYNLQGRMASVVNEGFDANGTLTARDRTEYEYGSKSYRVKLTNKTDAALDGNFTLDSTTEFLASHRNFTGYTQALRETNFDANGNVTKQIDYTFGDDEIAQRVREFDASGTVTSDQTLIFGHDGHGSVRVLYDLSGAATKIVQAFTFSAYGQMIALHNAAAQSIAVSGRLSSTGYSGETFDSASQQQYIRARFYNSANGRFNRLDDFAGNNSDPQSLHKYAYVHGDPIGNIDPTGLFSLLGSLSLIGFRGVNVVRIATGVQKVFDAASIAASAGVVMLWTARALVDLVLGRGIGSRFPDAVSLYKASTVSVSALPSTLSGSPVSAAGIGTTWGKEFLVHKSDKTKIHAYRFSGAYLGSASIFSFQKQVNLIYGLQTGRDYSGLFYSTGISLETSHLNSMMGRYLKWAFGEATGFLTTWLPYGSAGISASLFMDPTNFYGPYGLGIGTSFSINSTPLNTNRQANLGSSKTYYEYDSEFDFPSPIGTSYPWEVQLASIAYRAVTGLL